jgi:hypothetical protein
MSKFQVIEVSGKFVVKSDKEVLAVMDSREAAELACAQLNYTPGKNPCETFYHSGRLATRQQGKDVAA